MLFILFLSIFCCDFILSVEISEVDQNNGPVVSGSPRQKRQFSQVTSVIPEEVKDEFKEYAKSYLNSMVTEMARKPETKEKKSTTAPTKRTQICAEVCKHRCLPSCEWACCIKDNIEEYRSAHLVKPLTGNVQKVEKKSLFSDYSSKENEKTRPGKKRANFVKLREHESLPDGSECKPSCKRFCLPSCRFACCQPVQVKGVLLF